MGVSESLMKSSFLLRGWLARGCSAKVCRCRRNRPPRTSISATSVVAFASGGPPSSVAPTTLHPRPRKQRQPGTEGAASSSPGRRLVVLSMTACASASASVSSFSFRGHIPNPCLEAGPRAGRADHFQDQNSTHSTGCAGRLRIADGVLRSAPATAGEDPASSGYPELEHRSPIGWPRVSERSRHENPSSPARRRAEPTADARPRGVVPSSGGAEGAHAEAWDRRRSCRSGCYARVRAR